MNIVHGLPATLHKSSSHRSVGIKPSGVVVDNEYLTLAFWKRLRTHRNRLAEPHLIGLQHDNPYGAEDEQANTKSSQPPKH
jgi:hypothetical protein